MKRQIITTNDGSVTIHLPEWNESYHSKHGAIQEAKHVFIQNGLYFFEKKPLHILEIGFGTGLNAFLTLLESENRDQSIHYTGMEAYPVDENEITKLNYSERLSVPDTHVFSRLHAAAWNREEKLTDFFTIVKRKQFFQEVDDLELYDLIYFDAFGYRVQPELWSEEIFKRMYNALKPYGVLVTYACRTPIRKAMQAAGFQVEKLPGPPGKREMLRATKNCISNG